MLMAAVFGAATLGSGVGCVSAFAAGDFFAGLSILAAVSGLGASIWANAAHGSVAVHPAQQHAVNRRRALFLATIEGDIVDIDVGPAHGGTEGDRVDGSEIEVGRAFSESDLAELGEGDGVKLPIGGKLDARLPAILAGLVAAWRRRIA